MSSIRADKKYAPKEVPESNKKTLKTCKYSKKGTLITLKAL